MRGKLRVLEGKEKESEMERESEMYFECECEVYCAVNCRLLTVPDLAV